MSAVQCLVVNLFGVLTEIRYSHFIDVLKMSLTVFLFCMAKVRPLVAQRKLEEDKITEAFGRCEQMMKDWIVHKCGSALGASRVLPKTELVVSITIHADCTSIQILCYCSCGRQSSHWKLQMMKKLLRGGMKLCLL